MPRKKPATPAATSDAEVLHTYKGFTLDMTCQGFQFEVGGTYRHPGELKCCPRQEDLSRGAGGFHACEHPLGPLRHYPPATSIYGTTLQRGPFAREVGATDTKVASAEITVTARIDLPELIAAAVKYVFDRARWIGGPYATGANEGVKSKANGGAATASGYAGAATASGWWGAATASGDAGAATASGDGGAATASGTQGAATASGDGGAATASGDAGAATASGYAGAATASGWWGAATASGKHAVAIATGRNGKARGEIGRGLVLAHRAENGDLIDIWHGIVGRDGIKPMVWYTLDHDGNPVETE